MSSRNSWERGVERLLAGSVDRGRELGVPEQTVMNWLGHRNSAMVRHYYHLHDDEACRHMQRLSLEEAGEAESEKDRML